MKRVVIYVRVSSEEQKNGYSPQAQLEYLRDHAFKKKFIILKEFDASESARNAGRAVFNEMLEFTKNEKMYSLNNRQKVVLDWKHSCEKTVSPHKIDAELNEWQKAEFINCKNPGYIKEGWTWKGESDSWFRFATCYGEDYVYLALESFDDKLLLNSEKLLKNQATANISHIV